MCAPPLFPHKFPPSPMPTHMSCKRLPFEAKICPPEEFASRVAAMPRPLVFPMAASTFSIAVT